MLIPSLWKNSLNHGSLDRVFDNMFELPRTWEENRSLMHTDIKDLGSAYQLTMELPGFEKENIKADLEDGFLTITAERKNETEDSDKNYIHRERYMGMVKRSFQVEKHLSTEDIKASFENGILSLMIPKKEETEIERCKNILIE